MLVIFYNCVCVRVCVFTFLSLWSSPKSHHRHNKKEEEEKGIQFLMVLLFSYWRQQTRKKKKQKKQNIITEIWFFVVVALMRFRCHLIPSLPIPANNNNPFINIFIQLILLLRVKVTEECPPSPFKMAAIDFPIFFPHSIEEMKMGRREFDKHQTTPIVYPSLLKKQQCYTYNKFVFPLLFLCCTSPLILCWSYSICCDY